jgi:ABC-type sugar transport system permease subunit/ABC-type glycerol-3-phosphate transport system substrate-binding protein
MKFSPYLPLFCLLLPWQSLLPAGSAESAPAQSVEIVAQGLPRPGDGSIAAVASRAVFREFQELHPDIAIRRFSMPVIGVDAAQDTGVLMAISAGMGPNVISVNFRQSATFNKQGFLLPMETLLARLLSDNPSVREADAHGNWLEDPTPGEIASAVEQIRARVPSQSWPVVFREDLTGRSDADHVWSIPTSNQVRALFWRKDHFQEAGLDPEVPPATWDELMEFGRKLHNPAGRRHAMVVAPGVNISWHAYQYIVSSGGRAMAPDADGNWRAAFATRDAAEGIHFFWRLIREEFERNGETIRGVATLRSDCPTLWNRGQVSMQFGTLGDEVMAGVSPQLVGIAPVPADPRGNRGSELNAAMLGVFSQSTPGQQLGAMRYIWFLTGEEAQRIRTQVFVDRGFGQFVNPDLLAKFGFTRLLERVPPGWRDAYFEALEHGVPEPYGTNTQFIYRVMSGPINQALEEDYSRVSREQAVDDILARLEAASQSFETRAMGIIPPEEMRNRRIVTAIVFVVLVSAFGIGIGSIWRSFSKSTAPVDWKKHKRRLLWGWALLVPGFGLIVFWQYVPLLIGGSAITFSDYRVVLPNTWVGLDNFATILYDPTFWDALKKEFYFVALMIGLGFWPPILLAILLQEVPTDFAKYFFRTVFYLPSVLIGIVVMFLWMQLFDPSPTGTLNQMLLALNSLGPVPASLVKLLFFGAWATLVFGLIWLPFKVSEMPVGLKLCLWAAGAAFLFVTAWPLVGALRDGGVAGGAAVVGGLIGRFDIEPLRWLQDPKLAMLCVIIPSIWASSGPGCIIYLAGLKSVPDELYEAAAIDGAGFWHKVFYIVLPRLKFLIVINLIAAIVAAFKGGADQILIMTGGGPNEATTTLSLAIFYRTFMDLEYGIGTAMSWIMGALLIGFTAYQIKMLSRAEFKSAASKT